MTAAHYIALLLLSTAAEGSREHHEILDQNGEGIWLSLGDLNLVEREQPPDTSDRGFWCLTDRGRVLVEHILALPLPEQVNTWSMPGVPEASAHAVVNGFISRPGPLEFVNLQPPSADSEVDGPPPPKPALPKPIPGITPAEDPQARRAQALELINRGFGTSEIAETLEIGQAEVEAIFFGGSN